MIIPFSLWMYLGVWILIHKKLHPFIEKWILIHKTFSWYKYPLLGYKWITERPTICGLFIILMLLIALVLFIRVWFSLP